MRKFSILDGKMERRNVKALHELAEEGYDLVINCSGFGARELVADKTVTPIRGQVYKVINRQIYIATCFLPSSARIQITIRESYGCNRANSLACFNARMVSTGLLN